MQLFILFILLSFNAPASDVELTIHLDQFEFVVQDSLILYNVITPNNDGQNDFLAFNCLDQFETAELLVIDQWGKKVFESLNYQDDWNGMKNGNPVPAGQYKYFLNLDGRLYSSKLTIIYD